MNHFDDFLIDHAACERKASATGIHFVVRYPFKESLIEPMIRLAREELLHFQQVTKLIMKRGLQLGSDEKDPYVNELLKLVRTGREHHLLDRLLVFGLIERRGTERFGLVAEALTDPELKNFYSTLTKAEERHHEMFIELALEYFSSSEVARRVEEFCLAEAEILARLPIRAAVH